MAKTKNSPKYFIINPMEGCVSYFPNGNKVTVLNMGKSKAKASVKGKNIDLEEASQEELKELYDRGLTQVVGVTDSK